jgi:AcrR family transcriptional regulator
MTESTRDRLLDVALTHFAARGFRGVSIASIADDLGLTKQALLHHFPSKETLYGELLAMISADFEARVTMLSTQDPADPRSLARLLVEFASDARAHPRQTALLMRELLDNPERARQAGRWYLRGFLDRMIDAVAGLPRWQQAPRALTAAAVYQLLGAINYFAVSGPTLNAMFGTRFLDDMTAIYDRQLEHAALAVLRAGPAPAKTG